MDKSEKVLEQVRKELPEMAWHDKPVSKYSDNDKNKLTRCQFCLRYFELME